MYYSQINYSSFKDIENLSNVPEKIIEAEQMAKIPLVEPTGEKINTCTCKQNTVLEFVSFLTFGTFVILLVNLKH